MSLERPLSFATDMLRAVRGGYKTQTRRPVYPMDVSMRGGKLWRSDGRQVVCPFGEPGDRLWVRERFAFLNGDSGPIVYSADPVKGRGRLQWQQSRSLPREASRVLLEVVATRAERLHVVTEGDARREGYPSGESLDPLAWFKRYWDKITTPEQLRWAANPWVWVVDFRVIDSMATTPSTPAATVLPEPAVKSTRTASGPRMATMDEKRKLAEMIRSGALR
ncbi:MAG: hypothetical protein JO353_04285 [Phycisphaerae bacterium]|nr:hypothetical protein [Phycisphaerae bacterium]